MRWRRRCPSCVVRCLPLAAPVARSREWIEKKDGEGGRRTEGIAASCIAHRACGFRKWGTSRIERRGRARRLDWLAGSAVDAYRDFEARVRRRSQIWRAVRSPCSGHRGHG
ncbi:hypothetical protein B0H13DRAFT_2074347, partial [Mycena leptocephala]